MKQLLNVQFCDLGCWNITNVVELLLGDKYELNISDNPDFVFHSVRCGQNHKNYTNAIKIEINGESDNISPYTNYSLSMHLKDNNGHNFYMPLWVLYYLRKDFYNFPNNIKFNKTKFIAACIHKNNCCKYRINSLNYISSKLYEPIINLSGQIGNKIEDKYNALKDYKFNFCFENKVQNGYQTEKIMQAFDAGCIPVYRGDPYITKVFNEKAFINCNNLSDDKVVERINEINNNEELYQQMLTEPILVDNTYPERKIEEARQFLYNIIDSK